MPTNSVRVSVEGDTEGGLVDQRTSRAFNVGWADESGAFCVETQASHVGMGAMWDKQAEEADEGGGRVLCATGIDTGGVERDTLSFSLDRTCAG